MHLISYSAFGRAVGAYSLTSIHLPLPPQTPAVPAHHILIIDASGSMWGDMDQMRATLLRLFTATEMQAPHLRVSLLSYSSEGDVITHFARASAMELQALRGPAQTAVQGLQPRGLTCISQALRAAIKLVLPGETTCVSLHTDGWANDPSPASERKALLAATDELHKTGAWLSGIAYRQSSDFGLLSELASRCGGSAILAADTRQVYDAIHTGTTRAAGQVEPAICIDVTEGNPVLFLSVSAGRCILQREPGTLRITGLLPEDDRQAWVLTPSRLPEGLPPPAGPRLAIDNARMLPRLALCRAMLAVRDIAGAKGVLYGLGLPTLIERHARAMTPAALAALATELDALMQHGNATPTPNVAPGLQRREGASILTLLQVLDGAASGGAVWVHVPTLLDGYTRRGLAKVPGTRRADGTVEPPPVSAVKLGGNHDWQRLHNVEISDSQANANLTLTCPIGLMKPGAPGAAQSAKDIITSVAGVDLSHLKQFRAYTVVADGAPTVKRLLVRISDRRVRNRLEHLGIKPLSDQALMDLPGLAMGLRLPEDSDAHRAARGEVFSIDLADRSVLSPEMDAPQPGAAVGGTADQPTSGAWPEAALYLMALVTLRKVLDAALKGDGGGAKYSAEQVAALKDVCVTPAGYFSPPTTSAHADLAQALADGDVDTRITYRVSAGLPLFPQGADDLYGANEFLQRHFAVGDGSSCAAKKAAGKLTWRDVLGGAFVVAKEPSARMKISAADCFMMPIYARLLGFAAPSTMRSPYLLPETICVDRLSALLRARGQHKDVSVEDRAEMLQQELTALAEDISETRGDLRPLLWLTATTGAVPSSLPHEALDADAYAKRYGVSLDKAQREATFFVINRSKAPTARSGAVQDAAGAELIIAVVPEAQHYTVRAPKTVEE